MLLWVITLPRLGDPLNGDVIVQSCSDEEYCAGKSGIATAFFSESNASLARQLAELMQEANQEVPDWLTRYASRASFGGSKKRSGGQTGGNIELSSHASQVVPLGFLVDSQAQELVQNSHSSFLHEIYVGDRPCMCS